MNDIHRFGIFSLRKTTNYKYYNTSLASEIMIKARWMVRSGSWYEQEIISSWYNVDKILMACKKKGFFLPLFRLKISRILFNNIRLIPI